MGYMKKDPTNKEIREWAWGVGHYVSKRGPVPAWVRQEYDHERVSQILATLILIDDPSLDEWGLPSE